jgi:uncharacterized small protein (DUF1192 family)
MSWHIEAVPDRVKARNGKGITHTEGYRRMRMIEEEPPRPVTGFTPPALDSWSVAELRGYIARLQAEIARAEAAIATREAHRGAIDALFRRPAGEG